MKTVKVTLTEHQQANIQLQVEEPKIVGTVAVKHKGKLYAYSGGGPMGSGFYFDYIDPKKAVVLE